MHGPSSFTRGASLKIVTFSTSSRTYRSRCHIQKLFAVVSKACNDCSNFRLTGCSDADPILCQVAMLNNVFLEPLSQNIRTLVPLIIGVYIRGDLGASRSVSLTSASSSESEVMLADVVVHVRNNIGMSFIASTCSTATSFGSLAQFG